MATSIWTEDSLGPWGDSLWDSWTDQDMSSGTTVALEDCRLDLAAYSLALEDVGLAIWAQYQSFGDCLSYLQLIGWSTEDAKLALLATVLELVDTPAQLAAIGRAREDALTILQAIAWTLYDVGTYLEAGSSTVLVDAGVSCEVTDGQAFSNALTWLAAIRQPPAFRSTVAQRLSSVVSMATWTSLEDVGIWVHAVVDERNDMGTVLAAVAA